jgi:hypothetical protein
MSIVICPGIHSPNLTENFIFGLQLPQTQEATVFPTEKYPVYSPLHVLDFLLPNCHSPLTFIAFSAGVVGAIGAARLWQAQGGTVTALIALDGWGVPLEGDFPIHRISHDRFTAWSSALLGAGADSFYADPPVAHLELWRSPQTVQGWWTTLNHSQQPVSTTVANFITVLLQRYGASTQARHWGDGAENS